MISDLRHKGNNIKEKWKRNKRACGKHTTIGIFFNFSYFLFYYAKFPIKINVNSLEEVFSLGLCSLLNTYFICLNRSLLVCFHPGETC